MKTPDEIISILEAQEKALAERIKILEAQEKSLRENPELNKELLAKINQEIVDTIEEKAEITENKTQIKAGQRIDFGKIVESIRDYKDVLEVGIQIMQATMSPTGMPVVQDIQSAINPPFQEHVIQDHSVQHEAEIVTNPSENSKTFQEVADIKIKDVKEQFQEIDDKIKDAAELSIELPESKSAAGREWKEDITQKENELVEKHASQLKALKRNEDILAKQMDDAKKFPDSEKKIKELEPIKEAMKDERVNINDKFNKKQDEIKVEKEAFQNAVKNTKGMDVQEEQKGIAQQRREFEIQRERERLQEIQGR